MVWSLYLPLSLVQWISEYSKSLLELVGSCRLFSVVLVIGGEGQLVNCVGEIVTVAFVFQVRY